MKLFGGVLLLRQENFGLEKIVFSGLSTNLYFVAKSHFYQTYLWSEADSDDENILAGVLLSDKKYGLPHVF